MSAKVEVMRLCGFVCHSVCCSQKEALVYDRGGPVDNSNEQKKLTEAEQLSLLQQRLAALEKRSVQVILMLNFLIYYFNCTLRLKSGVMDCN